MRNDARPVGPDADDQSPLSEEHSRDVVNREDGSKRPADAFRHLRSNDDANHSDDRNSDPAMPGDAASLNTKI